MLRIRTALLPFLMLVSLLSACGGGGGGGSSGGGGVTPPPVVGPALSFSPATATASVQAGVSATINVSASVNRPADFANASSVFALVLDSTGVLLPGVQLVRDSDTQYHVALQTAPTLAAGSYQGNFTVKLCPDSACASQFPGSPMNLPYAITVTPAGTAAFSASTALPMTYSVHLGAAPTPVAITVKAGARSWTASSDANWISLTPASGSGDASLTASFNTGALTAGTYNATVTLTASDGQSAALPVSLTVLPVSFQFDNNAVTFTAINGAPIATQAVAFNLDNGSSAFWNAASDANWLTASPTSGTTPASIVLSIDPATIKLSAGTYKGNINLTARNIAPTSLPVTLNLVKATLLASTKNITLGGAYGRDFSPQTLTLSLNTSSNSWPLTLSGMPAWVNVASSATSVGKAPVTLTLTPDPTAAGIGITSAALQADAAVNGDTPSTGALVTINKDAHKLIPSETAVAMVGTPAWARISRTINVQDNFGQNTAWTAASDQPWLTVTTTATSLTLTADPNALTVDTLNTATVTITPGVADVNALEPIRVAFWKGSTAPAAAIALPLPYTTVVADPVRPLLYAHNGGAFIDVYHLYTQQKLATITGFSAALGDMATSPNGDRLYVIDINNRSLNTVDLNNRSITAQWQLPKAASSATRLRAIRPNGEELVVLSDGTIFQVVTGKTLPALALAGGSLAASGDGKRLYQQDEGKSSLNFTTFSIDYASLAGGTLFSAKQGAASHASPGSQGQDLAASADGSKVYSASSTPVACAALNPTDLSVLYYLNTNNAAPNNVEVGSDGRVYCGVAGRNNPTDVWAYSSTGALLQQIKFAPVGQQLVARRMAVSGDGFVLLGLTDSNNLYIVPIGP